MLSPGGAELRRLFVRRRVFYFHTNINGTHFLLDALKTGRPLPVLFRRFSEMFGKPEQVPQNERTLSTPLQLRHQQSVRFELTRNYREAYGIYTASGILFNHESPRRGYEFVTRKITSGIARIVAGKERNLRLGNLEAKRDWSRREYTAAMWTMLQEPEADDYVIGTGEAHSVREFAELSSGMWAWIIGLRGLRSRFIPPAEVNILLSDATKARQKLGWEHKVSFPQLVREMVEADCKLLGVEAELNRAVGGRV